MDDNNNYNIVCVSDEGYVQHTAVMLCSLFETNKDKAFHIYFLTTGICNESEKRLDELCQSYGSAFHKKEIHTDGIADLPVGQWNTIMYLKLFMPQVLPENVDRCLFLDVDMVINDNIDSLYNIDFNGNVLAAAEDIPDCLNYKSRLGLKPEDLYVNSGVMMCDLKQWHKLEHKKPIFEYTRSVAKKIQNEQDAIAMYFKDKIKCLPIQWNMTSFYFMRKPKIFNKYKNKLKVARTNPYIIHFACPIKPWFKDAQHPYKSLYYNYLLKTDWKDYKAPIYEKLTIIGRIKKNIRHYFNKYNIIKDPYYYIK